MNGRLLFVGLQLAVLAPVPTLLPPCDDIPRRRHPPDLCHPSAGSCPRRPPLIPPRAVLKMEIGSPARAPTEDQDLAGATSFMPMSRGVVHVYYSAYFAMYVGRDRQGRCVIWCEPWDEG